MVPSVFTINTYGTFITRRVDHHCVKDQGPKLQWPYNQQAEESSQYLILAVSSIIASMKA